PAAAGAVTEFVHWRWVFGGVAVFAVMAFSMIAPRLRGIPDSDDAPADGRVGARLGLAGIVAVAALVLNLAGKGEGIGLPTWGTGAVALGAITVVALAMRPLVPRRTYLAGRGLPSVILMRGLIAGALFGAEIYVPYLFQDRYGFSPTFAGLGLTAAAITWTAGSEITGRYGDRIGNRNIALSGIFLLTGALTAMALSAWLLLPPWIPIVLWGLAGFGMGLMYPRLTVLSLAYSTRNNQGFNSSALQISDAVGTASSMAIMGLIFTLAADGFTAVFAFSVVLALVALLPGFRLGHAAELRR
ncbi:MFS transporter, partial [Microbacterium amylolyticum]